MKKFLQTLMGIWGMKNRKLFITFFMILIVSIAFSIIATAAFLYYNSSESFKKEVGTSNLGQLKQVSVNIDLVLSEIDRTSGQFLLDEQMDGLIRDMLRENMGFLNNLSNMGKRLTIISGWNKVIHSIYVYMENSSRILNSFSGGIYNIDSFYDKGWLAYYGELKYSYTVPTRRIEMREGEFVETANVITHLRPIPFPEKEGAIVINIDEESLTGMIMESMVRTSEEFMATDETGEIILSSDKSLLYQRIDSIPNMDKVLKTYDGYFEETVNGERMIVTYTTSRNNQWKYISLIPADKVYDSINNARRRIITVCIIFILAGVIISFLISNRIYRPINTLLGNIRASMNAKGRYINMDEVGFIREMFGEVFGEKKLLEETVADSIMVLREKFFRTLVTSDALSEQAYREKLKSLGIPFATPFFQVVMFELNHEDMTKVVKTMEGTVLTNLYIKNLAERAFSTEKTKAFAQEIDNRIGVIVNYMDDPSDTDIVEIMRLCENVVSRCSEHLNLKIYAMIGTQVHIHNELPLSYDSAMEVLKFKQMSEPKRVLYIDEIKNYDSESMDLMFEGEEKLLRHISACDMDNIRLIIHQIMESLKVQKIEFRNIRYIFLRILESVKKSAEQLSVNWSDIIDAENIFNVFDRFETLDDMEEYLLGKCGKLVDCIGSKMSSRNRMMVERVKEYVTGNIAKDISVDEVASISGLSSSHFSKLFKQETGSTFVEHMNTLRIEKAKELLQNTHLKIKDIAFRVGFRNETYFITTFKNKMGITPKLYKDIQMWKQK